jgi:two-component system sensor kinase
MEEDSFKRADGTVQWVKWELLPWHTAEGQVGGILLATEEITARVLAREALRESEERYRGLFNTLIEGFCIIEMIFDRRGRPVDFRYLAVNPAFERQTGLHNAQGKLISQLIPRVEPHWIKIYSEVVLTGEPARFVSEAKSMGRWFEVSAYRIGGAESRKVACLFNDITAQKQAEKESRRLHQLAAQEKDRMASLVKSAMDAIISVDADQRVVLFNAAAEKMFHCAAGEAIGSPLSRFIPERFRSAHAKHIRRYGETGGTSRAMGSLGILSGLRQGGEEFPIEASISRVDAGGQKLFTVILRDITERQKAEEEIRILNKELESRVAQRTFQLKTAVTTLETEISQRRRLEHEILKISEREQARLGLNLHEDLSQQLAGIGLLATNLQARLCAGSHPCATEAHRLTAYIKNALDTARNLSKSFFPVELERGGLVVALEDLSHRTELLAKIRCQLRIDPNFEVEQDSSIHLYRIIQEAIGNAIKHGKAKKITIQCIIREGVRTVCIHSDGRGFKLPRKSRKWAGIGLHLLQYRARLLGATVEVSAGKDGKGCLVICRFAAPSRNSCRGRLLDESDF